MYYFSPVDMVFNYGASLWEVSVEVTDAVHGQLMKDLSKGYTISADANGFPISTPPLVQAPELPIGDVFKKKLARLNNDFENSVQYLKSTYPMSEAITWPVQLEDAKAILKWLEDNPTLTIADLPLEMGSFLRDLSDSRVALGYPNDLEHLANRVIENDALFSPAMAHVTAIRHVIEKSMKDAVAIDDIDALKAISWTFPFPPQVIE